MSVLSSRKRDKREFLIGVRDLKQNAKTRIKGTKIINEQIAAKARPENHKAFAKSIERELNIEQDQEEFEANQKFNEILS